MQIYPLRGVDNIILGMTKHEVLVLIGEPDEKEVTHWEDHTETEKWSYTELEIDLDFHSDDDFRLCNITIFDVDSLLEGKKPIGMLEKVLLNTFPSIVLDDDFEENGKDYVYPEKEISFWIANGIVESVTIFCAYDKTGEIPVWPKKDGKGSY